MRAASQEFSAQHLSNMSTWGWDWGSNSNNQLGNKGMASRGADPLKNSLSHGRIQEKAKNDETGASPILFRRNDDADAVDMREFLSIGEGRKARKEGTAGTTRKARLIS